MGSMTWSKVTFDWKVEAPFEKRRKSPWEPRCAADAVGWVGPWATGSRRDARLEWSPEAVSWWFRSGLLWSSGFSWKAGFVGFWGYRTLTQQLMPPNGLVTVTADPGSATQRPSTTKRYS